jgi:NAD(P)-dependent dehydrogenase (short-subunit alcohol dehydrogenase family)
MAGHHHFRPDLLAGHVAVVTGGGSGIGYAIAEAFAGAGAQVVITSRSADRLARAEVAIAEATGRTCASVPCDVREDADVERLRDFVRGRFGAASVVVNNAAANFRMPADRMTVRAMRTVVDVDLIGTLAVTRAFLPDLIGHGRGIVLSTVGAGVQGGFPGFSHAGAAKAAIMSLTCSWAREWGPHGIRVNAIAPGPVPTPGVTANMLGRDEGDVGSAFAEHVGGVPLRRLGRPSDVAAAAVFLCSDAASWITGVSLTIDGGLFLTPPIG